jgi:hypothetical protein
VTNPATSARTLERLAHLLRSRHHSQGDHSFVTLMVDLDRTVGNNTDDLNTQPMPVMRSR